MSANEEARQESKVDTCRIDEIMVPDVRVTSLMDSETYEELKESIKAKGILSPIIVTKTDKGLVLVDGLHRVRAAKEIGLETVPCIIREGDIGDILIDNLITARQKGTTNPADEALVIKALIDQYKYDYATITKIVGLSKDTIKKYYKIAQLPEEVLNALRWKRIGVQCAYYLTFLLPDREKILQVLEWAIRFGYTAEQCEAAVYQVMQPQPPPRPENVAEPTTYINPETGEPSKVYPRCPICGEEIRGEAVYIWLHPQCQKILLDTIAEAERAYEAQAAAKAPEAPEAPGAPEATPPAPGPESLRMEVPKRRKWWE